MGFVPILLLSLLATSSVVLSDDEHPFLNCNSLTGDLRWKMIRFSRSMENGDSLTITGTVYSGANMSYIHLYEGFNNVYEVGKVSLHIRTQYKRNSIIYNSYLAPNSWGREEFSSLPYAPGQRYTITIVKYPWEWKIYHGTRLLKVFGIRHPQTWSIGNLLIYGDWSADAVTMLCKRFPEPTTVDPKATTTTPKPTPAPTSPTSPTSPPVASDPGKGTDLVGNGTVPGNGVVTGPKDSDEPSIGGGDLPSSGNGSSGNGSSGNGSSGNGSSGNGSSGNGSSGNGNTGNGNTGKGNSGNGNTGNSNTVYPPGLLPPGFDPNLYKNGNGQPNIIIINQAPPPAPKRRRNRGPNFVIDGSTEEDESDEDCECEEED